MIQAVSHASLIGRVGASNLFLVGGEFLHRIGEPGMLELRINDVDLHDNPGQLKVLVEVD